MKHLRIFLSMILGLALFMLALTISKSVTAGQSDPMTVIPYTASNETYADNDYNNQEYIQNGSMSWITETVDSVGEVGSSTSLALDTAGRPHISYLDSDADDLLYTYHDGTMWVKETADSAIKIGQHTSLVLDRDGYPHISYGGYSLKLNYAYLDASGWHTQTLDSAGGFGANSSLVLDKNGHPHISYQGSDWVGISKLKYIYQNASGWHTQIVDSADVVQYFTSISLALDRDGYPHFSYQFEVFHFKPYFVDSSLNYAYLDSSGWHTQTVEIECSGGSLALDGDGQPHISYFDSTNADLKYAYQDASGWHTQTVDREGNVGWYTSLALDEDGYPHISYHDNSNFDLKYAYLRALPYQVHLPLIVSR